MQTCKVLPRATMHRDKKKKRGENNTQKHRKLKKATQHTTDKLATKEIQRQTNTFELFLSFLAQMICVCVWLNI